MNAYTESSGDMIIMMFMPMYSMELAMGASLNEKDPWATVSSGISQVFSFMGGSDATVERLEAHVYTVSYADSDGNLIEDHFKADPQGGIQMLRYRGGDLRELFEFVVLGEDTYAWQTSRERAVLGWDGEQFTSFCYTSQADDAGSYTEADCIFGSADRCTDQWVTERQDFHTSLTFDGETMELSTINFFLGNKVHAVIHPVVR